MSTEFAKIVMWGRGYYWGYNRNDRLLEMCKRSTNSDVRHACFLAIEIRDALNRGTE